MGRIGGNVTATLQQKAADGTLNAIGERIQSWFDVVTLTGFLDLSGGDSKYSTYSAKLQESTHVFICDYAPIERFSDDKRLLINGQVYDALLIDNPMELNQHLEIYLKYVGR